MSKASAGPIPWVEVITSVQRRRWSTAETVRLVEEAMQPGISAPFVTRPHVPILVAINTKDSSTPTSIATDGVPRPALFMNVVSDS